jgi:hypothetical protein
MVDFTTDLNNCLLSKRLPPLDYEDLDSAINALKQTFRAWQQAGGTSEIPIQKIFGALNLGELGMAPLPNIVPFFDMPATDFFRVFISCLVAVDQPGVKAALASSPPDPGLVQRFEAVGV